MIRHDKPQEAIIPLILRPDASQLCYMKESSQSPIYSLLGTINWIDAHFPHQHNSMRWKISIYFSKIIPEFLKKCINLQNSNKNSMISFYSNILCNHNSSLVYNCPTTIKTIYLNSAMNFHFDGNQYVRLIQIHLSVILSDFKLTFIFYSKMYFIVPSFRNGSLLHIVIT